jgi:hypothetical protein
MSLTSDPDPQHLTSPNREPLCIFLILLFRNELDNAVVPQWLSIELKESLEFMAKEFNRWKKKVLADKFAEISNEIVKVLCSSAV